MVPCLTLRSRVTVSGEPNAGYFSNSCTYGWLLGYRSKKCVEMSRLRSFQPNSAVTLRIATKVASRTRYSVSAKRLTAALPRQPAYYQRTWAARWSKSFLRHRPRARPDLALPLRRTRGLQGTARPDSRSLSHRWF